VRSLCLLKHMEEPCEVSFAISFHKKTMERCTAGKKIGRRCHHIYQIRWDRSPLAVGGAAPKTFIHASNKWHLYTRDLVGILCLFSLSLQERLQYLVTIQIPQFFIGILAYGISFPRGNSALEGCQERHNIVKHQNYIVRKEKNDDDQKKGIDRYAWDIIVNQW
jgi:hypothetical protein